MEEVRKRGPSTLTELKAVVEAFAESIKISKCPGKSSQEMTVKNTLCGIKVLSSAF